MRKISSWWSALPNTVRTGAVCLFVGIIIGAGITGSVWFGINRGITASQRSIITAYQSALADRNGQLERLDGELATTRALADERGKLDKERKFLDDRLQGIIREGERAIAATIGEYNKAVERLRLHQRIFDALRRYYDPNYKDTKSSSP